jgi:hypothetical protein
MLLGVAVMAASRGVFFFFKSGKSYHTRYRKKGWMTVLYKLAVDAGVLDERTAWRMDLFVDIQGIEGHFIWTDTN